MPAIRSHHWPSSLSCSPPERPTERLALSRLLSKFATQPAFPGHGQMKPEQQEIDRLRKEMAKLKAERDVLKKAAVYFAREAI